MTAISLFDAIARADGPTPDGRGRAARLATKLIEALLADWGRIRQFEEDFAPADWNDPIAATAVETSIYELYKDWAIEAEQVLARVRQLDPTAHPLGAGALEDAFGLAQARLKFTPEKTARGMEQVRRGEFTPAKELRDELRSRLRA